MGYYDSQENVDAYIRMAAGYDGRLLIDALRKYLPKGSRVLELGMGPGKDLLMLNQYYDVTGSDSSRTFVERFKKLHPAVDVKLLDAITIETEARFQGIYSNKALPHLKPEQLLLSFQRQAHALEANGIALHSFWHGAKACCHQGLLFVYYRETALKALVGSDFEVLESARYTEIETDDSLYLVLRKR